MLQNFKLAITDPMLALMLFMFFSLNLGFTHMETTFFLLLSDPRSVFHLGAEEAKTVGAIILGAVGIVQAFSQGFLVQRLVPCFGELRLLRVGYAVLVPSLCLLPWMPLWVPVLLVTVALGLSAGISSPCLSGLISKEAPPSVQGGIFGITQGLGALARCIGPVSSHSLFHLHPAAPYAVGASIALIPAVNSWRLKVPQKSLEVEPAASG